jgi:hypothetical protein
MNSKQIKQIAKTEAIAWGIGLTLLIPFYIYIVYSMLSLY